MEILLHLICRGEAWAVFSISFEDYPLSKMGQRAWQHVLQGESWHVAPGLPVMQCVASEWGRDLLVYAHGGSYRVWMLDTESPL